MIGSGPNGLAGAIALARAGLEVEVHEAEAQLGGGLRSSELTLPGFVHDVCSSIHPLGAGSPFFRELELEVDWIHPDAPTAHPFDDGTALLLERDLGATADQFGRDERSYRDLVEPLVRSWDEVEGVLLGPHPIAPRRLFALRRRLGTRGLVEALRGSLAAGRPLAEQRFGGERTRGWFAGHAAHSMLPLERRPSAGFGLGLVTLGHAIGWPFPRGGSRRLAGALAARLRELGGEIRTSSPVDELPRAEIVLADVVPRELVRIARGRLPERYERRLRAYRHGPGAFKLDWALDRPIPWRAAACARAGTVHLGGTLDEISASEWGAWSGRPGGRPFRPRVPRDDPRPARLRPCGDGGTQPKRRRGRPERRRDGPRSALLPSGSEPRALPDTFARRLSLLLVDAARRRRARDVRLLGGSGRAAGSGVN